MSNNTGKYAVPGDEGEILPNKPGFTSKQDIDRAEFSGFFEARYDAIDDLSANTHFDLKYLYSLHRKALGDLYTFAGKLRTVNMSKGGFAFPAARFLPLAMEGFEKEMLLPLNATYANTEDMIRDIAKMHAELLFIHPFREGNGRVIRLLTELIYLKHTGKSIDFVPMQQDMHAYIAAVQAAAHQNYAPMETVFKSVML